jgi:PAP2 superfamily
MSASDLLSTPVSEHPPLPATRGLRGGLQWVCRNLHFAVTVFLALCLIPALRNAHLPIRFAWAQYFINFWVVFGIRSLVGALLLFVLGCPKQFKEWLKTPPSTAPLRSQLAAAATRVGAVMLPAAYLFVGLILTFSYNEVIAALRFDGRADHLLNRIDSWIMGGATVSSLAHLAAAHLPLRAFDLMSSIYFLLFPALGSCIVFLALQCGLGRAIRFIGALMTAYYITLICFYFVPAIAPFVICPTHFSVFPRTINMYAGQYDYLVVLNGYAAGIRPSITGAHYFAAFPCMHIVQPLIALWFLRPWKRIAAAFIVFNALLIPCILLLEQHYVIDLIGGVVLAVLAVATVDGFKAKALRNSGGAQALGAPGA